MNIDYMTKIYWDDKNDWWIHWQIPWKIQTDKLTNKFTEKFHLNNCQALSISQSLNLSLSLRDRDRADTIITLYHTTPHHHQHLVLVFSF